MLNLKCLLAVLLCGFTLAANAKGLDDYYYPETYPVAYLHIPIDAPTQDKAMATFGMQWAYSRRAVVQENVMQQFRQELPALWDLRFNRHGFDNVRMHGNNVFIRDYQTHAEGGRISGLDWLGIIAGLGTGYMVHQAFEDQSKTRTTATSNSGGGDPGGTLDQICAAAGLQAVCDGVGDVTQAVLDQLAAACTTLMLSGCESISNLNPTDIDLTDPVAIVDNVTNLANGITGGTTNLLGQ